MKVKTSAITISILWLLAVLLSFVINYLGMVNQHNELAFSTARSIFQQIVITRKWNTLHGGIYSYVTTSNQPNPYLDVPDRDLKTESGRMLTKINPAYMTRQISEIAKDSSGVQFRITSLKPIRPQNQPTQLETHYLHQFEKGFPEGGEFLQENDKTTFFYMAPLHTEKPCLQCHASQGYKEGDIRGGISVTLPYDHPSPLLLIVFSHAGIGLVGIFGITLVTRKLDYSYTVIKQQAVIDALTNIPNRRNFSETIFREFDRSRRGGYPLVLIMCDIDHFKAYNDFYGHFAGDECLKQVAQCIKNSLQRPEDFCARYGGEEFVILLSTTQLDGGRQVADRIRQNIEAMQIPHYKSSTSSVVTVSLGVAALDQHQADTYENLIKRADSALYQAKEEGRNRVCNFC